MENGITSSLPATAKITDMLAGMQDQALQPMAQMYKGDPYILPLIVSESQRRQKARAQMQAMSAPQQQPKVVDQAIASMAPQQPMPQMPQMAPQQPMPNAQQMVQQLPENQGIARLPSAQNTEFAAEGGIMGYAEGGGPAADKEAYKKYVIQKAQEFGIDPEIALRLFHTESRWNPNAVSKKGATGLGQLMEAAAIDMGLDPEDRTDPYKNIDASLGYFARLKERYDGDDVKAAAAYNWGMGRLDKHLAANNGEIKPSALPKETSDYVQKVAAPSSAADQIPKDTPRAPVAADAEQPGFWSTLGQGAASLADVPFNMAAGVAQYAAYPTHRAIHGDPEKAEQFAQNLFPSWATNPVGTVSGTIGKPGYENEIVRKSLGKLGSGVESTSEYVADKTGIPKQDVRSGIEGILLAGAGPTARGVVKGAKALNKSAPPAVDSAGIAQLQKSAAQAAAEKAATPRLTAPGKPSVDPIAEAAMRADKLTAETRAAALAGGPSKAAELSSRIPAKPAPVTSNFELAKRAAAEALPTTEKAAALASAAGMRSQPTAAEEPFDDWATAGTYTTDSMPSDKTIIAAAKDTVKATDPEANTKGLSGEDWLQFGLRLMANKSPHFLQAVGEAGIGALGDRAARGKAAQEDLYRKALTRKTDADADYLTDMKGVAAAEQAFANDPNAKAIMKQLESVIVTSDPIKMTNLKNDLAAIRRRIYKTFKVTMVDDDMPSQNKFEGFKVMGVK